MTAPAARRLSPIDMSALTFINNSESGPSQPRTFSKPPSPQPHDTGTSGDNIPGGRLIYYGVKIGRIPGVYVTSSKAAQQVNDYPDSCVRCFSSRYAAQAYIRGWDCQGVFSLPKGSPHPLYEHLLINYSTPAYLLSPSPRARSRAAYIRPRPIFSTMDEFGSFAASLPPSLGIHPALASSSETLTHRASSSTLRPPPASHRNSWRDSMVKSPSPLRNQVNEPALPRPMVNGVYSPLYIPEMETMKGSATSEGTETLKEKKRTSMFGLPSFSRKQSAPTVLEPTQPVPESRVLPSFPPRQALRESRSSPNLPRGSYQPPSPAQSSRNNRSSGLWSEKSSPLAAGSVTSRAGPSSYRTSVGPSSLQASPVPEFSNTEAPTFSRAAMRKSGIVMPVAAPSASRSTFTTRRSPSTPSLSPSSSSSSISTVSSSSSSGYSGPTSDFAPPRAGFMRGPSGLSLSTSPSSSCESVATVKTSSPGGYSAESFEPKLRPQVVAVEEPRRLTREKKEKKEGVMKGFGKMFGIKKKA